MKGELKIFMLLTLAILGITGSLAEHRLVVPGRIWWYKSEKYEHNPFHIKTINVGFKIDQSGEDDQEWFPIMAVDSLKNNAMDSPVGWLREENGKVMIKPNFQLHETVDAHSSEETAVVASFLLWWNGDRIPWFEKEFPGYTGVWNVGKKEEFLLYDFNYLIGDTYDWPWSGNQMKAPENYWNTYITGPMVISAIEEKEGDFNVFNGERFIFYKLRQPGSFGRLELIEGLGCIGGVVDTYLGTTLSWSGFFFAPQSLSNKPDISSLELQMYIPWLKSVEDNDGSIIYDGLGESNIHQPIIINNESNSHIYDLHGRQISNPLPGTVYIRNGKKYVM